MKIKLLKQYGYSLPETVLDPMPNIAKLLIDRGIAEVYVSDEEIESAIEEIKPVIKTKKGKKKK